MSDRDLISLDALLDVLKRHLGQGDTGTLFIKPAGNHWGCFGLRDGLIVSVMCRGVKDAMAMQNIQNSESVSVRFDASQVTREISRGPQLMSDQIFAGLAGLPTDMPGFSAPASWAAPAVPSGVDVGRIVAIIKNELAEALGPICRLICDDLIAGRTMTPEDIQDVLGQLARDIGDSEAGRTFQMRFLEKSVEDNMHAM